MKKLQKLRAPGPAANIGESIAKEIGTIELLVLEIWLSQFLPVNMCQFCVYLCFDKFYANSNNGLYLILTYSSLIKQPNFLGSRWTTYGITRALMLGTGMRNVKRGILNDDVKSSTRRHSLGYQVIGATA